jgi:hypothetical protein
MITTTHSLSWGYKAMPPSFDECRPKSVRRKHCYKVEAASYALFVRAMEAKRSRWLSRHFPIAIPTFPLPAENVAAIKLLDSWLSTPDVEHDEFQERLDRLIEENRL